MIYTDMSETCIGKNSIYDELEREANVIVMKGGKRYYYKNRDNGTRELLGTMPAVMGYQAKQQRKKIDPAEIYRLKRDISDYYYHPTKGYLCYSRQEEDEELYVTEKFIKIIDEFDLPPRIKEDYHARFGTYSEMLFFAEDDEKVYAIVVAKVCELEERMQNYLDAAHIHDMLREYGLLKGATKQQICEFNDLRHETRKYLNALRSTVNK